MKPSPKKEPKIPNHVNAAIEKILEFYRIGREAPRNTKYKNHEIVNSAAALGMNEATLRKARAFATPKIGYTRAELGELILQLTTHNYEGSKWVLGISHVSRLLSIPKANEERLTLQQGAIENEWSCAHLDDVIRSRYGTRKKSGRPRQVPADPAGVLSQVEQECDRWERWWKSLTSVTNGKMPLEQLPDTLRNQLASIIKGIRKLKVTAEQKRNAERTRG